MKTWAHRMLVVAGVALATVFATSCRSGVREDPILRLSAVESLEEGKRLLEAEKYSKAREYFTHAFEVEPNSVSGREALLLVADTLFKQGGIDRLVQAEAKYRDFLNRFPTSELAPYVQYQIGNTLASRLQKPDRDQTDTFKARGAFEDLIRLFPDSEYADEAQERIVEIDDRLADHEFEVGYFYYRYGLPPAALNRWQGALEQYPRYRERDKLLYYVGVLLQRRGDLEEAGEHFAELRDRYPESSWIAEVPAAEGDG